MHWERKDHNYPSKFELRLLKFGLILHYLLCLYILFSFDHLKVCHVLLYRAQDVGKSKAEVAAKRVMERVSGVNIVPHFCRIEDKELEFYSQFQIIVLGLDSIEARSYINSVACGFLGMFSHAIFMSYSLFHELESVNFDNQTAPEINCGWWLTLYAAYDSSKLLFVCQ